MDWSFDAILYYHADCKASKSILSRDWGDSVFLQDVSDLEHVPDWIQATPCAVVIKSGEIYHGREAILNLLT
jgi:hypothetical protein